MDPPSFPPRQNALKCRWFFSSFHSSSSHPLCFTVCSLLVFPTILPQDAAGSRMGASMHSPAPALAAGLRLEPRRVSLEGRLAVVAPRKDLFPGPLCDTPSASTDFYTNVFILS